MKLFFTAVQIMTLCVLVAFSGSAAAQQAYPNKPIRVIVPYPPGGTIDPLARLIVPKLAESWGSS